MKRNELKLRIATSIDDLIDVYMGDSNIIESFTNSTLKLIAKAKLNDLDDLLKLFEDKNGNVDADTIVETYASKLNNGGFQFDIRKYVKNDFIRDILPQKSLVINKEDILKIVKPITNIEQTETSCQVLS